jgi:phosphoenolpyruvate carboxylase
MIGALPVVHRFAKFYREATFENQIRSLPVENTPAKRATNRALS